MTNTLDVPTYQLAQLYSDSLEAKRRYRAIRDAFLGRFGTEPKIYARAPGRVNLIGEHIDYEGYGVFPMAIALDTVVAVAPNDTEEHVICNVQSAKFPEVRTSADPDEPFAGHSWANYVLCGFKAVTEGLTEMHSPREKLVRLKGGLNVIVDGRVPTGSGLSSSAALICASFMAGARAVGAAFSRAEIAARSARAERLVGVSCGGMDQAISMLGQKGAAALVEFLPALEATPVALPADAAFVVANSLAVSDKAVGASGRYNLRVVECRAASVLLARKLGASEEDAVRDARTLRDVTEIADKWAQENPLPEEAEGEKSGDASASPALTAHLHDPLYRAAEALLPAGALTRDEVEAALGTSFAGLFDADDANAALVLREQNAFRLKDRALHVLSERLRVPAFARLCQQKDTSLETLGALMDASHASCRDLYGISCPELEELTRDERELGALGARVTGAGFGGCTVALVRAGDEDRVLQGLEKAFYAKRIEEGRLKKEDLAQNLFATKPAAGGGYVDPASIA